MISIKEIVIQNIDDYDRIKGEVAPEYIHDEVIRQLKTRIGLRINRILIEYPYYDSDYLSTYYIFYSKKHKKFKKEGYRVHFLKNSEYYGFLTLRPTVSYTKIGKTYFKPSLTLTAPAYLLTSTFKVHLIGQVVDVESYPWMYQETDISVCAHVALWNIARYYGNKYSNYHNISMGQICEKINEGIHVNRKVPSDGLDILQVSNLLRELDFSPLLIRKIVFDDPKLAGLNVIKEKEFFEEIYSYIESGIPCIGLLDGHAVSLVGHGEINKSIKITGTVNSFETIDSLIVVDDNVFPFIPAFKNHKSNGITKYSLEDFKFVLVPLYERMQFGYRSVKYTTENLFKTNKFSFSNDKVIRIYITSTNSLKREVFNCRMNKSLKDIICKLSMPKFVWCVDISTPEEYIDGKVSGRIIIDSTCCTSEEEPWLLIHDTNQIFYNDDGEWFQIDEKINPYEMYTNNLRRYQP